MPEKVARFRRVPCQHKEWKVWCKYLVERMLSEDVDEELIVTVCRDAIVTKEWTASDFSKTPLTDNYENHDRKQSWSDAVDEEFEEMNFSAPKDFNNGKIQVKFLFENLEHPIDSITNSSDTDSGFGSDDGFTKRQPRDYSSAQKSFTANLDLGVSNGLADISVKQPMTTLPVPVAIGHPTINERERLEQRRKEKEEQVQHEKNIVIGGVKSVYLGLDSLTLSNLVMSIINPPGQLTIHSLAVLVLRAFLVLQMRNHLSILMAQRTCSLEGITFGRSAEIPIHRPQFESKYRYDISRPLFTFPFRLCSDIQGDAMWIRDQIHTSNDITAARDHAVMHMSKFWDENPLDSRWNYNNKTIYQQQPAYTAVHCPNPVGGPTGSNLGSLLVTLPDHYSTIQFTVIKKTSRILSRHFPNYFYIARTHMPKLKCINTVRRMIIARPTTVCLRACPTIKKRTI
ncbi:11116_t:CDS:2 [Paraglomus brasilianum]|uniref:11116_t:CDS:1 n=1 Tax=Paraglomus brasilianum TaxID=144538 RepID=A0A9N9BX35_9GLOM|nr:11116_t:CDS:2 [Paraglomus brasilianum]